MLNISTIPLVKSSSDNLTAISNPRASNIQQSSAEGFDKALRREISDSTGQLEVSNSTDVASEDTSSSGEKIITPDAITDTLDIHDPIKDSLIDTVIPYQDNSLPFPSELGLGPSQDNLMTTPILPAALSSPFHTSPISQDSKLTASSTLILSHILQQQRLTEAAVATSNTSYSPDNLWQAFNTADFEARGNFLPFSPETNEAMQINTTSSPSLGLNEPIPVLAGLTPPTSAVLLNTLPQNVQIDVLVNQPKWGEEFAQKIVWLTTQQHQVVEIHLNPVHLGPVEVILNITQDQATAQFLSPHVEVLGAIEEALPRLREMMAENGIQLGNVMVGSDSSQQENKQQQAHSSKKSTGNMTDSRTEINNLIRTNSISHRYDGIINTYA